MSPLGPETTHSTAIYGGGSQDHRKIVCEESLGDADGLRKDEDSKEEPEQAEVPPDLPPESFWLSKDAEQDWFDRNAFYESKESTKGTSNSTNLNPNLNPSSNSNSQRFSLNLKSKASILGLPKPQKASYADAKNRRNCKIGNTRLFPKRSGSVVRSDSSMVEPTSPKVSCIGRVRSKKERNRRLRSRHRSSESSVTKEKPVEKNKTGFFASFRSIFRTGRHRRQPVVEPKEPLADSPPRRSVTSKSHELRVIDLDAPSSESIARNSFEREPPGLGSMKRFVSGRKSGSWGVGEMVVDVA